MGGRRLFVIWTHPLFHDSVRLLLTHPEVEWLGAASDCTTARAAIRSMQPDTILLEETEEGGAPAELLDILEETAVGTRVIRLSLATNDLRVYRCERHTLDRVEDLLSLIRSGV